MLARQSKERKSNGGGGMNERSQRGDGEKSQRAGLNFASALADGARSAFAGATAAFTSVEESAAAPKSVARSESQCAGAPFLMSSRSAPTLGGAIAPGPTRRGGRAARNMNRTTSAAGLGTRRALLSGGSKGARKVSVGSEEDNLKCSVLQLTVVCGVALPKLTEQQPVAGIQDRHRPESWGPLDETHNGHRSLQGGVVGQLSCTVEVHGGGRFHCAVARGQAFAPNANHTTPPHKVLAQGGNGLHPVWTDEVDCVAEDEEDAIVSFHIYDRDKLLAWEAIPWIALRPGYRTVKLRASPQHLGGNQLLLGSLFVHAHFECDDDGERRQELRRRRQGNSAQPGAMKF